MELQLTTGNILVDVFLAFVAAMGSGKGAHIAWRRYANGKARSVEPVSSSEMQEIIKPLLDLSEEQSQSLRKLVESHREMTTIMKERVPPSWFQHHIHPGVIHERGRGDPHPDDQ